MNILQIYKNMGTRYFIYRVHHEIEKRLGLLKRKHPTDLSFSNHISLEQWRNEYTVNNAGFLINFKNQERDFPVLEEKAKRILAGELEFFNAEWLYLGKGYNWITNPSNGYVYDANKHWSEIQDISEVAGDIKYVWEKSRFSWLLTLIRYDYYFEKDLSEFVFSEIESWIDHNHINKGPNWRCSQEISLRLFNWYFALNYYKDSAALTENRWEKIINVIYASFHHVYTHINFSRIAVRNNHAITETLCLALSEILFPFISETKKWAKQGRKWFEQEIAYQIYDDGTFLQFSMNYHRVVIQLLTFGISITERVGKPFSNVVYDKAYKSLNFLYQCTQDENGWLPNYGSNDGALFFPWSDTDYRDYRPQLNSLHKLLTGKNLYADELFSTELNWWGISKKIDTHYPALHKIQGIIEYPIGGYILICDQNTFTFIRCGSHKDRPAQADNLHIDVWVAGKNILRDSGTYKYNTTQENLNYFMGTQSHNTVVVNGQSQMLKGDRFIWYYWTQKENSVIAETEDCYTFNGVIKGYSFLNEEARIFREVRKVKGKLIWFITDEIIGLDSYEKQQIWHIDDNPIEFVVSENNTVLEPRNVVSFDSKYYGVIETGKAISFPFKKKIETKLIVRL
ncbi:heparinase II/III domain-containing protein [Lonepinella koalarum]|uniref:Heparinase II/III-like protein n=1 Tax=Lonepinella koalarum TaxID=53417 RepID=A0A4R1KYG4_9PAST|nr:heparinase II/III family protein [Lonepinella koalarum]TCK70536.1 heparinase II/III-like protein [Lonepinella koalarum]